MKIRSSQMVLAPILVALFMSSTAMTLACRESGVAAPPTSTPIPTHVAASTPSSTPIPSPTLTPIPTATPTPTMTPSPEPTRTSSTDETHARVIQRFSSAQGDTPAPDFELTLFDGEIIRLSDLEGKVVVLNFWASWCPPCRWEMPDFEEMWLEYGDRGVVFVGVAISDFEEDARAFAEETGVTYPIGLDKTGVIARAYRPTGLPTTFFIDREGNIARRLTNAANKGILRVFLEGQLKDS